MEKPSISQFQSLDGVTSGLLVLRGSSIDQDFTEALINALNDEFPDKKFLVLVDPVGDLELSLVQDSTEIASILSTIVEEVDSDGRTHGE